MIGEYARGYATVFLIIAIAAFAMPVSASVLDPASSGIAGQTKDQSYDSLVNALFANGKTATTIEGKLWVPWFKTSSSCNANDLQNGGNCNAGEINFENNCMVTDEFSQVGVLIAMGKDQQKMDSFYNTLQAIKSTNGNLPAWRIYRSGSNIQQCKQGVNGNCDTASDASVRIITSLLTASQNNNFDAGARSKYFNFGKILADDFLAYEVVRECKQSSLGYGDICNWLAGGSDVKRAGMSSNDFAYTGYYGDAIIAMLQACSLTKDQKYCTAAKDFTLNYLQASNWDKVHFSAPPGKSFRWDTTGSVPKAVCTNNCAPVQWDGFDAPRALNVCTAQYYAEGIGYNLPGLKDYCRQWGDKYMRDTAKAPLQYNPDGSSGSYQSGYFAQGLQSLFQLGYDKSLFEGTLNNALSHYTPNTQTWDSSPCFGVYTTAFAVRGLGTGLGRDANTIIKLDGSIPETPSAGTPSTPSADTPNTGSTEATPVKNTIKNIALQCSTSIGPCSVKTDKVDGICRTAIFGTSKGDIKILGCEKENDYAEVYKQSSINYDFKACMGEGCVDRYGGFAKFKLGYSSATSTGQTNTDQSTTPSNPTTTPNTQTPTTPTTTPITPAISSIKDLPITCKGSKCLVKQDTTSGTCRTLYVETDIGNVKVMGCNKESHKVELYRQAWPQRDFQVCMHQGCVDRYRGFAVFTVPY